MTNEEILKIALQQSAYDFGCSPEDFLCNENKIFISTKNDKARAYLSLPLEFDIVSYGSNVVAQVSEQTREITQWYINKYEPCRCFETPNILALNEKLMQFGQKVCFMAEYFLPDVEKLSALSCLYETRLLFPCDFEGFYSEQWSNALCEKRKHLDKIAVGAYDGEKLVGLAGASADCENMYQIGIDVLPEYRRQNIACTLTSRLAIEILKLGKVPFYCAAWSNIKSVRNAIKCGFRPAWVQITAKPVEFADEMIK